MQNAFTDVCPKVADLLPRALYVFGRRSSVALSRPLPLRVADFDRHCKTGSGALVGQVCVRMGQETFDAWGENHPERRAGDLPSGFSLQAPAPPRAWVAGTASGDNLRVMTEQVEEGATCEWRKMPAMPGLLSGGAVAVLDGELYACGGWEDDGAASDVTEFYDSDADEWLPVAAITPPVLECRLWRAGGVLARQLSVGRRRDVDEMFDSLGVVAPIDGASGVPLDVAMRFDSHTGAWIPLPSMLEPRGEAAACVLLGQVCVCGGLGDVGGRALASAERYDAARRRWELLPAMTVGRARAAAGVFRGRLVVCGGLDTNGQPLHSAERLNLDAWCWEALVDDGMYLGEDGVASAGFAAVA